MPDARDLARRWKVESMAWTVGAATDAELIKAGEALADAVLADDTADVAEIARIVAERDAADTGERLTLSELAESVGVDLDSLADDTADRFVDIVFDGPPQAVAGRFVEVENERRESIRIGKWITRDDGYWVLRVPRSVLADDTADKLARAETDNARLRAALEQISGTARWYARFYTGGSDG